MKPAQPDKKSVFVKKSCSLTHGTHNFTFNFSSLPENVEKMSVTDELISTQDEINNKKEHTSHYVPSDNNFRFNFEVDEIVS